MSQGAILVPRRRSHPRPLFRSSKHPDASPRRRRASATPHMEGHATPQETAWPEPSGAFAGASNLGPCSPTRLARWGQGRPGAARATPGGREPGAELVWPWDTSEPLGPAEPPHTTETPELRAGPPAPPPAARRAVAALGVAASAPPGLAATARVVFIFIFSRSRLALHQRELCETSRSASTDGTWRAEPELLLLLLLAAASGGGRGPAPWEHRPPQTQTEKTGESRRGPRQRRRRRRPRADSPSTDAALPREGGAPLPARPAGGAGRCPPARTLHAPHSDGAPAGSDPCQPRACALEWVTSLL